MVERFVREVAHADACIGVLEEKVRMCLHILTEHRREERSDVRNKRAEGGPFTIAVNQGLSFNTYMITRILILVAALLPALLVFQWLNDKYRKNNEIFRKIIHIFHGVTLAALAFIAPLGLLIVVEGFFLVSIFIARYLSDNFSAVPWIGYMSRVYKVDRISYGEYLYPISAILVILLTNDKWIFAGSILTLGLADAAAALVGKKYGKKTSYTILGQKKSLVGSTAFYIVALFVVFGFTRLVEPSISVSIVTVLWVTLVITFSENIGVYGTDNLLVPLTAAYLLSAL